ncbi:DNA-binding protein [Mucilaginibacter sp. BJC16-A38]|uniref:DNA-binding protein n=1 Tax=Mucilaginibacter phenanthrenivorans TaxID=1234842 RepID=UPI0021574021|nr:DNA-binding protein [Mucilaginibacter phenanthrenivorans]MCR8561032.1 DNA-binding protein [Mucilaginibacter phenanthrenivorans]
MQAEFICLEDKAFKAVIDKVVAYIKAEHGIKEDKWISPEKAMAKLNVGKTTLQRYRNENLIRYSELSPRAFLYDIDSINEYIDKKSRDKF